MSKLVCIQLANDPINNPIAMKLVVVPLSMLIDFKRPTFNYIDPLVGKGHFATSI
jgi:hypothetical protein